MSSKGKNILIVVLIIGLISMIVAFISLVMSTKKTLYKTPTSSTSEEPQSGIYLKINSSQDKAEEVCGVFDKGTVCLKYDSKGYNDNFNATNGKYKVTGYIAKKRAEMEEKGAKCSFSELEMNCKTQDMYCSIDSSSYIECYIFKDNVGRMCQITSDGVGECS